MANLINLGQGTYAHYVALESKSQYEVYFCTDTHQIFVGSEEYTKGTKLLNAVPTEATVGDKDRLYFYNNTLYLCGGLQSGQSDKYVWTRVANINDVTGTVTSVAAGSGLETADGQPITSTGTISHSVPTGAATTTDDLSDQSPAFGSTFAIKGVATDEFGHVVAVNDHAVTIPTQTSVTVTDVTGSASTLSAGDSFTVITGVGMSTAAGATDHDLAATAVTFTLPADQNVTYEVSSTTEGVVTLTGSDASSSTALINGWNDLAKKSDITAVFKYKGQVTNVSDLPQTEGVQVGDVYNVINGSSQGSSSEYVCTDNTTPGSFVWEELGTTIDLSAYATTAWVEDKLTWHTF